MRDGAAMISKWEEQIAEADTLDLLYQELRAVMDDLRIRLNADPALSDREVVALVPIAIRPTVIALPQAVLVLSDVQGAAGLN